MQILRGEDVDVAADLLLLEGLDEQAPELFKLKRMPSFSGHLHDGLGSECALPLCQSELLHQMQLDVPVNRDLDRVVALDAVVRESFL